MDFAKSLLREIGTVQPEITDEKEYHRHILELAGLWDFSFLRGQYWASVYDAVNLYLSGTSSITSYKNRLKASIDELFQKVVEQAWTDAGSNLPISPDASSYVSGAILAEKGYVDNLFIRLRMLRAEEGSNAPFIAGDEANHTAENWARTLDSLYANIKLLAVPGVMLTFSGDDGKENCGDCKRYKNKRHRASWWVKYDAVPPSRNFECQGYRCKHHLVDDDGRLYTL